MNELLVLDDPDDCPPIVSELVTTGQVTAVQSCTDA
jgi:hypothetical protein